MFHSIFIHQWNGIHTKKKKNAWKLEADHIWKWLKLTHSWKKENVIIFGWSTVWTNKLTEQWNERTKHMCLSLIWLYSYWVRWSNCHSDPSKASIRTTTRIVDSKKETKSLKKSVKRMQNPMNFMNVWVFALRQWTPARSDERIYLFNQRFSNIVFIQNRKK